MNWKNVKLIFLREVRDQLRDRRTLFMVLVLPLLMYPALGIGLVEMTLLFSEKPRTVVLLGAADLPEQPRLLLGNRFRRKFFSLPGDAAKLNVVTDLPSEPLTSEAPQAATAQREKLLNRARRIRAKHREMQELDAARTDALESGDAPQAAALEKEFNEIRRELNRLFSGSGMQVLMIIPENLGGELDEMNQRIADRNSGPLSEPATLQIPVIHNNADQKSQIAYRRVRNVLELWEAELLKRRLSVARLPATLPAPVAPQPVDLSDHAAISDSLWSAFLPAILVVMAVTGAFYPAIDLAAGEKERGTMETLLICPASRTEIVLGKFGTVMAFSVLTALLNLVSIGFTGGHVSSLMASQTSGGGLTLPSLSSLAWVVVLVIPLAALFSALCLALATFARSSKEGQYYLTPLLMVTLGLTAFCMSPSVEMEPFYSILPVAGPALLLKQFFIAPAGEAPYAYLLPVIASTVGYSALALWWAVDQFSRESVLFREAERFELKLWLRRLITDRQATPTFAAAAACFVLIMLQQFGTFKMFAEAFSADDSPGHALRLQILSLALNIAAPALLLGLFLTRSWKQTFRLRLPKWDLLAMAVALPVVLHPLSVELLSQLEWFFPELPAGAAEIFRSIGDDQLSIWLILGAFAVVPALCEEIAFRGFILSGFSSGGRIVPAIILSSAAFGIVHLIPQQVFNATLLGLVLALITLRSNSLLPAVLFHFTYNSLQVLRVRIDPAWLQGPAEWFVTVQQAEGVTAVRYNLPTIIIAAVCAGVLLRRLLQTKPADGTGEPRGVPAAENSGLPPKPHIEIS